MRRSKLTDKIDLIFINKVSKIKDFFKFKDKCNVLMKANAVYKVTCSCGASYVGPTERNICHRMAEHATTSGSGLTAVGEHSRDNSSHCFNLDLPEILGFSKYWNIRIIKESLYIPSHKPNLNIQTETRDLYLFSVS